MRKPSKRGPRKAIIDKVFPKGPHGAYILTTCEHEVLGEIGISVSLKKLDWDQEGPPPKPEEIEEGTFVLLYDIRKKRGGWRAGKFKFLRPEDETRKEETGR